MNNALKFCVCMCVVLSIVNFKWINELESNNSFRYFFVPFHELVNIFVVSIVVYYFVEVKNDERATKKQLEGIANKLIKRAENTRLFNVQNTEDINFIRIEQRIIFNEIADLEKCAESFGYEDEIRHCKSNFNLYWQTISDNIYDVDNLRNMKMRLHTYLAVVINTAEDISLKLYHK